MNKELIKKILDELPIGWYLGRSIPVTIDDEEGSYINLLTQTIHLSYADFTNALKGVDESSAEYEDDVRCLLYHEISHAILTSIRYGDETNCEIAKKGKMSEEEFGQMMNVFEDERIETLNRRVFHRVNFKRFIKKVCGFPECMEKTETDMQRFFNVVRFRVGKPEFLKMVDEIIGMYSDLSAKDPYVAGYQYAVYKLYKLIAADAKANPQKPMKGKGKPSSGTGEDNASGNPEDKEKSDDNPETSVGGDPSDGKVKAFTQEEFKDVASKVIDTYTDKAFNESITRLIKEKLNKKAMMAGGSVGYSGRMNPRNMIGDTQGTYRWMERRTGAQLRNGGKLHLNLYIDHSGSFMPNDKTMNDILQSLNNLEKSNPQFSFSLVLMAYSNEIADKTKVFRSHGGNRLNSTIIPIIRKLNENSRTETITNIFLFDGDAWSDSYDVEHDQDVSSKAMDMENVIVITDPDNEPTFSKMKKARTIISTNYTDTLKKNILNALSMGL
jgi:hypothetical protein